MDADLDLQYDDNTFMKKILNDLLSHNDSARRRVLNTYYLPNAKLTSPLVSIHGLEKIKNVFALTTALSTRPPVITNVVFDNKTCAVQLVSFLKVPLVPLTLNVPSWTVLHFKETDLDSRLLKVWWHEESWTIEGILQAMPVVSKFYSSMVRAGIGKLLVGTGKLLETVAGGSVSHSYDLPTRASRESRCSLFKTVLISWSDFLTRAKLIVPRPIHKPVNPYQRQQWILQQQSETLGFTCLPPRYITNF